MVVVVAEAAVVVGRGPKLLPACVTPAAGCKLLINCGPCIAILSNATWQIQLIRKVLKVAES
jgi:hypothetical protein